MKCGNVYTSLKVSKGTDLVSHFIAEFHWVSLLIQMVRQSGLHARRLTSYSVLNKHNCSIQYIPTLGRDRIPQEIEEHGSHHL
jgi:hypothetical protein